MRTNLLLNAIIYLRLSREEAAAGESSSIANQRKIIQDFCKQHDIIVLNEFSDDGYSGGNFDRPGFQSMMKELEKGIANIVITKDLSRLGRDMREASYYAEQFFPEHNIRYIAIADSFDTAHDNVMAPFLFAMNEVYLRDGSRKVKDVLRNKRERGEYCACPPYGYKKDGHEKGKLVPDELSAPVVRRIFERAAHGDSSRKIAMDLTEEGIYSPLKFRIIYRGNFSDDGAARASDTWNYTTVKRILKNQVYLGHTLLGKTKKASVKSKKKISVPTDEWCITENTHEPLVSQTLFNQAQLNLGRGSKNYQAYDHVRKSIFGGIAYCSKCGHALCSCGTVYKGEREKYWYLSCINQRSDIQNSCDGVRIKYTDILEIVRQELNSLLSLTDEQIKTLVEGVIQRNKLDEVSKAKSLQKEQAEMRLITIDKMVAKLYTDNIEGRIDNDRFDRLMAELEKETAGLKRIIIECKQETDVTSIQKNYYRFFELARKYTHIDELSREVLQTFIERIEVGPKIYPEGTIKATHRNQPFRQSVKITYRFIGEVTEKPDRSLPLNEKTQCICLA